MHKKCHQTGLITATPRRAKIKNVNKKKRKYIPKTSNIPNKNLKRGLANQLYKAQKKIIELGQLQRPTGERRTKNADRQTFHFVEFSGLDRIKI